MAFNIHNQMGLPMNESHANRRVARRVNLKDAVDDLAPMPPPCFHNRSGWLEYLKSATAAQNHAGESKVILISNNGEPAINLEFSFCDDCTKSHRQEMQSDGRCIPNYLKQLKDTPV